MPRMSPVGIVIEQEPLALVRLSGLMQLSAGRLVDVIFSYTHRATDVTDKQFVRVDVTDEFPFLATKLSPYYDR